MRFQKKYFEFCVEEVEDRPQDLGDWDGEEDSWVCVVERPEVMDEVAAVLDAVGKGARTIALFEYPETFDSVLWENLNDPSTIAFGHPAPDEYRAALRLHLNAIQDLTEAQRGTVFEVLKAVHKTVKCLKRSGSTRSRVRGIVTFISVTITHGTCMGIDGSLVKTVADMVRDGKIAEDFRHDDEWETDDGADS